MHLSTDAGPCGGGGPVNLSEESAKKRGQGSESDQLDTFISSFLPVEGIFRLSSQFGFKNFCQWRREGDALANGGPSSVQLILGVRKPGKPFKKNRSSLDPPAFFFSFAVAFFCCMWILFSLVCARESRRHSSMANCKAQVARGRVPRDRSQRDTETQIIPKAQRIPFCETHNQTSKQTRRYQRTRTVLPPAPSPKKSLPTTHVVGKTNAWKQKRRKFEPNGWSSWAASSVLLMLTESAGNPERLRRSAKAQRRQ